MGSKKKRSELRVEGETARSVRGLVWAIWSSVVERVMRQAGWSVSLKLASALQRMNIVERETVVLCLE